MRLTRIQILSLFLKTVFGEQITHELIIYLLYFITFSGERKRIHWTRTAWTHRIHQLHRISQVMCFWTTCSVLPQALVAFKLFLLAHLICHLRMRPNSLNYLLVQPLLPVTVADRCTVFARSEVGVVDSNPIQDMDVWCVCVFFCVCVVLCLCKGLATSWSPDQGVLPSINDQETEKSDLCSKMGVRGGKK
jgi:hypothetical protein